MRERRPELVKRHASDSLLTIETNLVHGEKYRKLPVRFSGPDDRREHSEGGSLEVRSRSSH